MLSLTETACYRPCHWPPPLPPTVTFVGKTVPIGASRVLIQTFACQRNFTMLRAFSLLTSERVIN